MCGPFIGPVLLMGMQMFISISMSKKKNIIESIKSWFSDDEPEQKAPKRLREQDRERASTMLKIRADFKQASHDYILETGLETSQEKQVSPQEKDQKLLEIFEQCAQKYGWSHADTQSTQAEFLERYGPKWEQIAAESLRSVRF